MNRYKAISEAALRDGTLQQIASRLPGGWRCAQRTSPAPGVRPDATFELIAPRGETAVLIMEIRTNLNQPSTQVVVQQLQRDRAAFAGSNAMLIAPYLSPTTRARLRDAGMSYADSTGNLRLAIDEPPIFIETTGANKDPWPDDLPLRSLKGRGAGRAVRAFCDFTPPYGIRALAARSDAPAPSLSRVAILLEREALLTRERERGSISAVDWQGTLRRWSLDYSFSRSNRVESYLEPRGLPALRAKLRATSAAYAVTGSLAANELAPIAAPRLAAIYVADRERAASELGLRRAEAGANVMLAEPYDAVAFQRGFARDDIRYASASQVAVDLLTGPGRSPAEGEALLQWMQENESAWRA